MPCSSAPTAWCPVSGTSTRTGTCGSTTRPGRGDWAAAKAEQSRLRKLFEIVHVGDGRMGRYSSAMGAFKEGLVARGVITSGTTSEPMIPLNDTERAAVRSHLVEAGLL